MTRRYVFRANAYAVLQRQMLAAADRGESYEVIGEVVGLPWWLAARIVELARAEVACL